MSSPSTPPRGESSGVGSLVRTVVVLAIVVLAFTGLLRACTFAPTSPDVDRSSLPRIDAAGAIANSTVAFGKRSPVLPPTWISQSSDVTTVGASKALRVGWVTPENGYLRLVQSDAAEDVLVRSEQGDPTVRGTVTAGGRAWVVHTGQRSEAMWVADVDGVRLLITGNAPPERFTELATATLAAPAVR